VSTSYLQAVLTSVNCGFRISEQLLGTLNGNEGQCSAQTVGMTRLVAACHSHSQLNSGENCRHLSDTSGRV
jgi:hypothetical protein